MPDLSSVLDEMREADVRHELESEIVEGLYRDLRVILDSAAIGGAGQPLTRPGPESKRGGRILAVITAAAVILAVGLAWLVPPVGWETDFQPAPRPLSTPEGRVADSTRPPVVIENPVASLGGYQFSSWRVLPEGSLEGRVGAAVAWTGEQLLVWGGEEPTAGTDRRYHVTNDGGVFDARGGIWFSLPPAPLSARSGATGLWTGSEMLVLGGTGDRVRHDGAAYDAATRLWRHVPPFALPVEPAAVWSGREAILWDGVEGVAFDPKANSWRAIAPAPASDWFEPAALWTGTEMIVWDSVVAGSVPHASAVGAARVPGPDVAAYSPATDTWRSFGGLGFDLTGATGLWTGRELILWGSANGTLVGAALDPARSSWRTIAAGPFGQAPGYEGFGAARAVWTGSRMLVWVGSASAEDAEIWSYDPETDLWERGAGSPVDRFDTSLLWTGETLFAHGTSYFVQLAQLGTQPNAATELAARAGTQIPLSGRPTLPFEVLAVSPDRGGAATVDFGRRLVTVYSRDEHLLPTLDAAAPLWNGWLALGEGNLSWFPEGIDRQPIVLAAGGSEGSGLDAFAYVLATADEPFSSAVWMVAPGAGYGDLMEPGEVAQIGSGDGTLQSRTVTPPDLSPVNAASSGLLLNQNDWIDTGDGFREDPGSFRMKLIAPDGSLLPLWAGYGLHLSSDSVVWQRCDEALCAVVVSSIRGGPQPEDLVVSAPGVTFGARHSGAALVSPDGRWLLAERTELVSGATDIVRIDLATGEVMTVIADRVISSHTGPAIVWSADSQWVMVLDRGPTAVRIADGTRIDLSESIPKGMLVYAVAAR